jgi:Chaperone of endosialidase
MKTPIRFFKIFFAVLFLALLPNAQAVVPPPDGGYPNFTTAEGQNALFSLTTGSANTAVGWFSLFSNTEGSFNTGVGAGTLLFNIGDQTNGDGTQNTAVGTAALLFNTTGFQNTATGAAALLNNTTGNFNIANGGSALFTNTTGGSNTAIGFGALFSNTGNLNIALGVDAGANLTTGNFNIDIGNTGVAGESGTIRIGDPAFQSRTFIAAIRGVTTGVADAIPVLIDSAGQLGTMSSSRRFKEEIKPMDQTSEAIHLLKPVTFHYKGDTTNTPQFGLIAEEVAEVNSDLVVRDEKGGFYTVRYDQVNAMLLNEFLKEHNKVQELEATVTQQQKNFERQQKQIDSLTSNLQRVGAQLEMNKATRTMALNDQ